MVWQGEAREAPSELLQHLQRRTNLLCSSGSLLCCCSGSLLRCRAGSLLRRRASLLCTRSGPSFLLCSRGDLLQASTPSLCSDCLLQLIP